MAAISPSDLATAYQRYHGAILAKCRRILGDAAEAEDIAQKTFVRMWKEGPKLLHDLWRLSNSKPESFSWSCRKGNAT
jgi:DNA-directed RNA polymerase specialized sigma24 family protein